jgi:hypothetical protein
MTDGLSYAMLIHNPQSSIIQYPLLRKTILFNLADDHAPPLRHIVDEPDAAAS